MTETPECPRCQAAMEPGFLPDWAHGTILQLGWCRGTPEQGWLSKIKVRQAKDSLPITVFRCPSCGMLEMYAFDRTE